MTVADRAVDTSGDAASGTPYLVVSGDSHAGPSLAHQLRDYCPKQYLEQFDDFVERFRKGTLTEEIEPLFNLQARDHEQFSLSEAARQEGIDTIARIRDNPGSQDPHARLRDMDADGVTSELIFAGAQNPEVLPWAGDFDAGSARFDPELRAVGSRIWNAWLADFCSVAPERLLGVAQIPIWDRDAAIEEVVWAKEHGLRALNFPAPRPDYAPYNRDLYEPFWSAVEDVDLPLVTHSGSGERGLGQEGIGTVMLFFSEVLWLSRRGLGQLVFGGVFDRHPRLKVGFVEQRGYWVANHLRELDSIFYGVPVNSAMPVIGAAVEAPKRPPSEYWSSNCFLVASFMAPFEVATRHDIGIHTMLWGTDYPHLEGTWPRTRLAMRNTFAGVPEAEVRAILGDNGARIFNLDTDALRGVADRIGPAPAELATPPAEHELPAYRSLAFREHGSFH